MPKIANMRERVHQPFRDSLVRTSGYQTPNPVVQARGTLFTISGRNDAESNVKNGQVLPSDQSVVVLVLRVLLWFRHARPRTVAGGLITVNGDFLATDYAGNVNSAPADALDIYRLYWQASEQLLWDFGFGEKDSIKSMPSSYFPWGGGLHGDFGGNTDLIHWNNGMPDHSGILRLGRAILGPPRQGIKCQFNIVAMTNTTGGTPVTANTESQGNRNLLNLVDNLNAIDLAQKNITFCFDGLLSRDVQ